MLSNVMQCIMYASPLPVVLPSLFPKCAAQLPHGLNAALYFTETQPGAAFGLGYCDAQCPRDLNFFSGEAHLHGQWVRRYGPLEGKYPSDRLDCTPLQATNASCAPKRSLQGPLRPRRPRHEPLQNRQCQLLRSRPRLPRSSQRPPPSSEKKPAVTEQGSFRKQIC